MRRTTLPPTLAATGFTLPELLAVIAIVGGLWLVGSVALARAPDARLRAVAHELVLAMRVARARAISLNHAVYVDFAPAPLAPTDGVYTAYADLDDDHAEGPGEREAAQVLLDGFRAGRVVKALPHGIHFGAPGLTRGPGGSNVFADGVSFSGGVDRVAFFPGGNAGAGTVYLSTGDGELVAWAVRTNVSGTIESWSFEDGRWRRRS